MGSNSETDKSREKQNKPEIEPNAGQSANSSETSMVVKPSPGKSAGSGSSGSPGAPQDNSTGRGRALRLLLILLVLAGFGYGAYRAYINYSGDNAAPLPWAKQSGGEPNKAQSDKDTGLVELRNQLDQLEGRLNELQNRVPPGMAELDQQLTEIMEQQNSQAIRLQELSTTDRSDWLLAEAEFLLRLANQRLLTERNTHNALALMTQADSILRDRKDTDLFAVRKALAADMAAMRMVKSIDREGLYLEIDALTDVVDQLRIQIRPERTVEPETESASGSSGLDPEAGQNWLDVLADNLRRVLEKGRDMIRIRRRDAPVMPLLGPDDELYLRANLRLLLEQAGLALMQEQPEIYSHSLKRAAEWIRTHFEQDEVAEPVAARLEQLAGEQIVQELPDISGSLKALQNYIELRHSRELSSPAGEAQ